MNFITATTSDWFLIGPIADVLGMIMNGIFEVINAIGLPSIGLAIILFTIIIKALMIPLSIKQQKFSKLNSVMSPELQAIQAKYKGKTDNASLVKQQEETKEVYEKYGTSPTGGCLQMLIQMPILFALYQVIYKIPGYITRVRGYYEGIVSALTNISGYESNEALRILANSNSVTDVAKLTDHKSLIDMMYNFSQTEWAEFLAIFNNTDLTSAYEGVRGSIDTANYFLGMDLSMTPMEQLWPAVLIPILAGLTQWLSTRMSQTNAPAQNPDAPGAGMMKSMNLVFPLMSLVFCFMFPVGIGVYWVASAAVQVIIQLFVNRYMNSVDIQDMVQKNVDKMNAKRVKKGLPPKKVTTVTKTVKNLEVEKEKEEQIKEKVAEQAKEATSYYEAKAAGKKGSLAAKASMVQQYDERMKEMKTKGKKK